MSTIMRKRGAYAIPVSRAWLGWVLLALSVGIYAAVSIAMHQPFHAGGFRLRFFDLRIYRLAALRVVHDVPLYGVPMLHHLGFTYPPFAALLLAPLAAFPLAADALAVTGLNVLLLVWCLHSALWLGGPGGGAYGGRAGGSGRRYGWSRAAALAAAALWLEPISVTLGYGQIDLLITALVVFDLSRPDTARTKGAAIGVAAAIKLTPLLFIPYLVLSRHRRAAGLAVATFAGSIAVSFLIPGHDGWAYWSGRFLASSRVGNLAAPINQSLLGAVARLTSDRHPGVGWELLIGAVAIGGVALAARASRRGDEAGGFSLIAVDTLLASPVSWNHHWALAVPALAVLAGRAHERRSARLGAAAALVALAGYSYLPEIVQSNAGAARGLVSLPITDPYTVLALGALAFYLATFAPKWRWQARRATGVRGIARLTPVADTSSSQGLRR